MKGSWKGKRMQKGKELRMGKGLNEKKGEKRKKRRNLEWLGLIIPTEMVLELLDLKL